MVTPLGIAFSNDKNAVMQADIQPLGKTVESLVIEFDQEKFEEFLFSGFASPKIMQQYCKVSSKTRPRISSEITPRVARTTAHSTNGATSEEVLITSCAVHAARVNIPQGTRRANALARDQSSGKDKSRHPSPLWNLQIQVTEGSQQPL